MGFYQDQVLPRVTDVVMNRGELTRIRDRVAAGLRGEVLEVGFGSGLNVPHYPSAVNRVLAVDPAVVARKLAAKRIARISAPVEFIGLDGQHIPLESGSVDHALSTWTLCTIPDAGRALKEIRRVLRSGGALYFAEHGRSPDTDVARWQDRFTPLQRRLAGGCHLNRPIDRLITDSGLEIAHLDNYYVSGSKAFAYMFEGTAIRP